MKVTAGGPIQARPSAETRAVPPTRTPATRAEMRAAIGRALESELGASAGRDSRALVDTLTAQACLETGSGASMYNYNFGGIKGQSPNGLTTVCRTHEVIGGKDVVVRDGFRAYRSLDEGARDYVRLMKSRFGEAMNVAARGDVPGFAKALKKAGYYTAAEADYTRGLTTLMGNAGGAHGAHYAGITGAPNLSAAAGSVDEAAISRVRDAFDVERVASALTPGRASSRHDDDDDV